MKPERKLNLKTNIMQHYIDQLIEDLKEAKKFTIADPVFSDDYDEFERQMLEIENAPDIQCKNLIGISFEQIPPPEKLSEIQMQQLVTAITDTFETFNISVDFTERMPLILRYELLRDIFKMDIQYMPGFTHHFDFCSGDCEECKIAAYCDTKDSIRDFDTEDVF